MFAGNRLKILRKRKNLTQNDLSDALGYERSYGYKRIGQYEREQRHPKEKTIIRLSELLQVDPSALMVPDIPSKLVLMQLFFAMEDEMYFSIHKNGDEFYFTFDEKAKLYSDILPFVDAWYEKSQQLKDKQITKEEYDEWRYTFPASYFTDSLCARFSEEVENKNNKHISRYRLIISANNDEINNKFEEIAYKYIKQNPGKTVIDFFRENPNIFEDIYKDNDNE